MSFFKPVNVPRTNVFSDNPILLEGGTGKQGFFLPSSKYFAWQEIPHDNKWKDGTPSFMAPIPHYHILQSESFRVVSGSGYWYVSGKKIRLNTGDEITIPRCALHRFESIPNEKQEPLVIWYRYDGQRWEMEERLFRNFFGYMEDCRRAGVEPSLAQLQIFQADCWLPADIIQVPGPEYLKCAVNTLFMWIMALIGIFVFGYKRSYPEYYNPEFSRKRIEDEEKKVK